MMKFDGIGFGDVWGPVWLSWERCQVKALGFWGVSNRDPLHGMGVLWFFPLTIGSIGEPHTITSVLVCFGYTMGLPQFVNVKIATFLPQFWPIGRLSTSLDRRLRTDTEMRLRRTNQCLFSPCRDDLRSRHQPPDHHQTTIKPPSTTNHEVGNTLQIASSTIAVVAVVAAAYVPRWFPVVPLPKVSQHPSGSRSVLPAAQVFKNLTWDPFDEKGA